MRHPQQRVAGPRDAGPACDDAYSLRVARPEDFEFCYQLNKTNMRAIVERLRRWDDDAERAAMRRQFRPGIDRIVVVRGWSAGHLGVDDEGDRIVLRMIALVPAFQSRGIGSALVEGVLRRAGERGVPVALRVSALNPGARRLYARLGFADVGTVASADARRMHDMVWVPTAPAVRPR